VVDRAALECALFDLAAMWVESVDAAKHAEWLDGLLHACVGDDGWKPPEMVQCIAAGNPAPAPPRKGSGAGKVGRFPSGRSEQEVSGLGPWMEEKKLAKPPASPVVIKKPVVATTAKRALGSRRAQPGGGGVPGGTGLPALMVTRTGSVGGNGGGGGGWSRAGADAGGGGGHHGRALQVYPGEPRLDRAWFQR
jgi:hypothetical protein